MTRRPLTIIHCFRAPVGGVFRHVRDLAEEQAKAGHAVGIICNSTTGGAYEEELFASVAPSLALGVRRFPMRRQIAPSDIAATFRAMRQVRSLAPDILHAHGAKGGVYARVIGTLLRASGARVARIYSPHGGSLHYDVSSLAGRVYFAAERVLERMTDAFIFVSAFEAAAYAEKVGKPYRPARIVRNGLRPEEFEPVVAAADARDFVFVGTLRDLKGPDVFIEALARLRDDGGPAPTAAIVGAGEDKPRYEALVRDRGLSAVGHLPAADAGTPGLRARPRHGGAVAGGIDALHRPGNDCRRASPGRHQGRRDSRKSWATTVGLSSRRATSRGLPPPCASAGTTCRRRRETGPRPCAPAFSRFFRSPPWHQPSIRCMRKYLAAMQMPRQVRLIDSNCS